MKKSFRKAGKHISRSRTSKTKTQSLPFVIRWYPIVLTGISISVLLIVVLTHSIQQTAVLSEHSGPDGGVTHGNSQGNNTPGNFGDVANRSGSSHMPNGSNQTVPIFSANQNDQGGQGNHGGMDILKNLPVPNNAGQGATKSGAPNNGAPGVPCDPNAHWKNHGEYVKCVAQLHQGGQTVAKAAQSDVGKKGFVASQAANMGAQQGNDSANKATGSGIPVPAPVASAAAALIATLLSNPGQGLSNIVNSLVNLLRGLL